MKDPAKRYVSIAQALEMLPVSERTIRRWITGSKPRLHTIEDASGHRYIDQDDILAIQAKKPELKKPLPDRVGKVEEDVQTLKGEVEELKQQVSTLLALMEAGSVRAAGAAPARRGGRPSLAEARGYPAGTLRLVHFASKHGIAMSEIQRLHWQGEVTVSIYKREDAIRNENEWWITPEQHRAVVMYYQQHGLPIQTETCDSCSVVPLALSN